MILLLGSSTDWCINELAQYCQLRGLDHAVVSDADLEIAWTLNGTKSKGYVRVNDSEVPLDRLTGVFVRESFQLSNRDFTSQTDEQYIAMERCTARLGWLNSLTCPVINRPQPGICGDATIHGFLADAIERAGLTVPAQVMTANETTAAAFIARHDGIVLARSFVDPRPTIVTEWSRGPVCLQAIPEGRWVRAFVADRWVVATAAEDEEFLPGMTPVSEWPTIPVNPRLYHRCCRAAANLKLQFCEFLLRRGDDGRDYCFYFNPMPSHAACEPEARATLTSALIEMMARTRQIRRAA